MKSLKQIALFLFVLLFASLRAALSYDCPGHRSLTPDGPAYLLPKILPIYSFDVHKHPCIGVDTGRLNIDEKGNAKLSVSNVDAKVSSIKDLNAGKAKELLGSPVGPQGEDDNNPYFWTFTVLTIHAFELNLYHIDVQFADAAQHWQKYRVRGYQISDPQWQAIE